MIIICRQGNGHYAENLNNQDYYFTEGNLKLITDGCSGCKFSEVGTRLFNQCFGSLKDRLNADKFEKNVETCFSKITSALSDFKKDQSDDLIANNLLFTIIACFELEDKFVVKFIGDGYIIAVNQNDMLSFIRLSYGKTPPYYAYNKLSTQTYDKKLKFKTLEFPKKDFKKVGIASDGIMPIAEKKINEDFEPFFLGVPTKYTMEGLIKVHQNLFYDDVTILF